MYPLYFSAVLRTDDGQFLEIGEACVSETSNSVDFTSEFVPIMQFGTTAQIARVLGDTEFECFVGKVYLSSRKLLQITDVPQQVIEDARRLFSVNQNIPASLILAPGKSLRFNMQKADRVSGSIRGISADTIKIIAMEFIPEGQHLLLSVEIPSLKLENFMVRVRERVLLKRSAAILLCDPIEPSTENMRALETFLSRPVAPADPSAIF